MRDPRTILRMQTSDLVRAWGIPMNMLADAGREIPAYAGMTWLWGWSCGLGVT